MESRTPSPSRRVDMRAWRWLPIVAAFAPGVFAIPATSVPRDIATVEHEAVALPAATTAAERSRARRRCGGCGWVRDIRRVEATDTTPVSFEFTVRLYDGSVRTSSSPDAGRWRVGDRITLLGGEESN